jgi:hypothetical protein
MAVTTDAEEIDLTPTQRMRPDKTRRPFMVRAYLTDREVIALQRAARLRRWTISRLVTGVFGAVLRDELIDAVLDEEDDDGDRI